MGFRKTDYYIKLILNSTIEDLVDIQDQIENDPNLSTEELEWLEISIADLMSKKSHINLRLVNKITGLEEKHTQITNHPFTGNAMYQGDIYLYGLNWKVYMPPPVYMTQGIKKWYYNRKISEILTDCLIKVVPGNFQDYFHYPPWLLGTSYAPSTAYMSLQDIIVLAIARKVIPGWEYLIEKGIPKLFVEELRENSVGTVK